MPTKRKKLILLYAADEEKRSLLKFALETCGYRVMGSISAAPPVPHCVIVIDDRSLATAAVALGISRRLPLVKMLVVLLPGHSRLPYGYPVSAQVIPANCRPIDMLERVRIAS